MLTVEPTRIWSHVVAEGVDGDVWDDSFELSIVFVILDHIFEHPDQRFEQIRHVIRICCVEGRAKPKKKGRILSSSMILKFRINYSSSC